MLGYHFKSSYKEQIKKSLEARQQQKQERKRGMILLLLDKVGNSRNKGFIRILNAWKSIKYKKVRTRIQEVIDLLEQAKWNKNSKVRQ